MATQIPKSQSVGASVTPPNTGRAVSIMLIGTVAVVLLVLWYVASLLVWPPSVSATATGANTATLHIKIVPAVNTGQFPNWVGYQVGDFNSTQSATILHVPTNTWVTMTIDNYDSAGPLRNDYFNLVQGTKSNVETVSFNGKEGQSVAAMDPGNVSHTFSIPGLGVSVPMAGITVNNPKPTDHEVMTFTFYTGSKQYRYHWQCFDPCGDGAYGNGGPMQTLGYMGGYLVVG